MPAGMDTYIGSSELRESLLSILKDVSPNEDNYFVSNLGNAPVATNTYQEWNTYYEARPTSVTTSAEGADTTYADLQSESRTGNYTAIIESPIKVSRTMASVATVTGADEVTTQKERALRRLKAKMEFQILNGPGTSPGISGVARNFAGIDKCLSTLVTTRATSTSFTEVELNDMMEDSWKQVGADYVANMMVGPVVLKRRVAGFGTNLTRNVQATSRRLTQDVRVYDTSVGPTIMILAHKDVQPSAAGTTAYLLNDETFGLSFLVDSGEPHWEDRAKDGDNTKGVYLTEFTLASFAQRANVKRTGFASTL